MAIIGRIHLCEDKVFGLEFCHLQQSLANIADTLSIKAAINQLLDLGIIFATIDDDRYSLT